MQPRWAQGFLCETQTLYQPRDVPSPVTHDRKKKTTRKILCSVVYFILSVRYSCLKSRRQYPASTPRWSSSEHPKFSRGKFQSKAGERSWVPAQAVGSRSQTLIAALCWALCEVWPIRPFTVVFFPLQHKHECTNHFLQGKRTATGIEHWLHAKHRHVLVRRIPTSVPLGENTSVGYSSSGAYSTPRISFSLFSNKLTFALLKNTLSPFCRCSNGDSKKLTSFVLAQPRFDPIKFMFFLQTMLKPTPALTGNGSRSSRIGFQFQGREGRLSMSDLVVETSKRFLLGCPSGGHFGTLPHQAVCVESGQGKGAWATPGECPLKSALHSL